MRRTRIKETDLAAAVVAWLSAHGWEVYQEVKIHEKRADIVATLGAYVWVVECKVSMGLAVMEQAAYWSGWANMVSVAVPSASVFARSLCSSLGLGLITYNYSGALCERWPRLDRRTSEAIRKELREEHKTFAAAGSNGRYWSPWRATCEAVADAVRSEPGIGLRELLKRVKTHYASESSARACLVKWIEMGKVQGVELRREGRLVRLYPVGTAPPSAALFSEARAC